MVLSFTRYFLIVLLSSCSSAGHWSYYGVDSPDQWGKISTDFKVCELGHNQSPIDLSKSNAVKSEDRLEFFYHDSKTKLVDNGHTIKAIFLEDNFVKIGETKYHLDQLHFHAHSEHSVEGVFYPIEMHLVHKSANGELAVLAFFIDINASHPDRFGFFQAIKRNRESYSTIKLKKLMSYVGGHFFYRGSLTTPPCTEGVSWVVFDKHIKLHPSQVEKFRAIYTRNYRPVKYKSFEGKVFHTNQ